MIAKEAWDAVNTCTPYHPESFVQGYIAGAEPREKRNAELEAEVTRLRNENLDIINKYTRFAETDRRTIAELEAQIEKMKCCRNCLYQGECDLSGYEECKNFDKWEIKEK